MNRLIPSKTEKHQNKIIAAISSFLKTFSILVFMPFVLSSMVLAQTQSIEMSAGSEPAPNTGPSTSVVIPLFHNIENPNDNVFTPYFPNTTVTISLSDFAYDSDQNTNNNPGDSENPPVVIGWTFNPGGPDIDDGITAGASTDLLVPFDELEESIVDPVNRYTEGQLEAFYSSTQPTIGNGISFSANRGAFISASFTGLGGETEFDTNTPYVSGARYRLATMTISFNRPVNNPILHFFGLGGFWEFFAPNTNLYINSASAEFTLIDSNLGSPGVTMDILSANPVDPDDSNGTNAFGATTGLAVDGNNIINSWNYPDVIDFDDGGFTSEDDDAGVANGSIIVNGEGITTLTFHVFARAIRDIPAYRATGACEVDDGCYAGSEGFGWSSDGTNEAEEGVIIPEYNIASDAFILSVSAEVEPDETLLTEGDSFRMLSSPVAGTTYDDLIGNLWTQGTAGNGYDTEFGDPNVFRWPLGAEDDGTGDIWESGFDLNSTIPNGHGFLMTVFDIDDLSDPTENNTFPKTLSVTGSEPSLPFQVFSTEDQEGWLLLGNPMKDPMTISTFLSETPNLGGVVYVWDRGTISDPDKGWRYSGTLPGGVSESDPDILGTIQNGVLMPFQGFFVRKTTGVAVNFNNSMRNVGAEGTFYRKELPLNVLSFSVTGENLSNTLHLSFSENGTFERSDYDGLELASYNENYVHFGTKKSDGKLLTLAHFPEPGEDFELPLSVETTIPGRYSMKAEDFSLALPFNLYLVDTQENVSMLIDENFSYTFTINQAAKANPSPMESIMNGPQKATTEFGDRFLITTQPREVDSTLPDAIALQQNYPNPFNPTTQIRYELPQQSDVRITVYDMVGRQVATLVNETVQAGTHTVNFDASNLSSGVYLYRLQAGSTTLSRKLTVIK
ncbi:MAG: T9SS type A sorting domain-containing protein [Balneolaceae bacterium]|nr:T9SS type A sorting domain-containing protein [Balneolaceae bacterium]